MPLQHILLSAPRWVHNPFAYRLTGLVLDAAAIQRRFSRFWPGYEMAGFAAAVVALSRGFRSATFWGDADALLLLFSACACLLGAGVFGLLGHGGPSI